MIRVKIQDYFRDTPLAQNTYELLSPESYVNSVNVYSPYSISTWNYGFFEPDSVEMLNMWLHEMCHVIEMYHFNRKHRLLLRDYGFKVGVMTNPGVKREAWVIALQYLMSDELYGRASTNLTTSGILEIFNGRGVSVSHFEWNALVAKYKRQHRAKGLGFYYDIWQQACAYVKENR